MEQETPNRRSRTPLLAAVGLAALVAVVVLIVWPPGSSNGGGGSARVSKGIWISLAELERLPTNGAAWQRLRSAASGFLGSANISDLNSGHDVRTLAVALVYARTGQKRFREKAANALMSAIGTEDGGGALALSRNVFAYVVAADLIALRDYDRGMDDEFRAWLKKVRGQQLVSTHELRPNNFGTHAGASRVAIDVYLGDKKDLNRAAKVFRGWLGDRTAYTGFDFGHLWWQADRDNPVGVNPAGASAEGRSVDGALPEEMRRGGKLKFPPDRTGYTWEALQGALAQAYVLSRQGYDVWNWQNKALLRAVEFLHALDGEFGGWWATGDDAWQPWLVNAVYGTSFPTSPPVTYGKNMGFTDWTHAAGRGPLPSGTPPPPPPPP